MKEESEHELLSDAINVWKKFCDTVANQYASSATLSV